MTFHKPLIISGALLALLIGQTQIAAADGAIYFGLGAAQTADPTQNGDVPLSFGIIGFAPSGLDIGFDFGREGTMLDSTWGQNDPVAQASSFNLILGHKISSTETSRLDIGALIGLRQAVADCPDSYLGYQCYADTAPNVSYEMNYGVVMTLSLQKALLGVRATGESVQAIVGLRF